MENTEDLQVLTVRQWKALLGVGLATKGYKDVNPHRISAKDVSRCIKNSVGNLGDVLSNLAIKREMLKSRKETDLSTGRERVVYKLTPKGKNYINHRIKNEQITV